MKELRCLHRPPRGFSEVVHLLGTILPSHTIYHKKNKGKEGGRRIQEAENKTTWRKLQNTVLHDCSYLLQTIKKWTYKDIMNISNEVIQPIEKACNEEEYMNEEMMSSISFSIATFVKFLKFIVKIKRELQEDCTELKTFAILEHTYIDICRRKKNVKQMTDKLKETQQQYQKNIMTSKLTRKIEKRDIQANSLSKTKIEKVDIAHRYRSNSVPITLSSSSLSSSISLPLPVRGGKKSDIYTRTRSSVKQPDIYSTDTRSSRYTSIRGDKGSNDNDDKNDNDNVVKNMGKHRRMIKVKGAAKWSRMMKGLPANSSSSNQTTH